MPKSSLYYKILFFIFYLNLTVTAQTTVIELDKSSSKIFNDGIKEARAGKYREAIKKFEKVIAKNPKYTEAIVRKAATIYDMGDKAKALEVYANAVALDPTFNPEMYFAAGQIAYELNDNETTVKYFQKYLQIEHRNKDKISKADRILKTAMFRIDARRSAKDIDVKRLSENVNSPSSEYLPAFTIDGSKMVFTRRVGGQEDLLISNKNAEDWTMAIDLEGVNTPDNEGAHTISADGKIIVYSVCNRPTDYGSCDLYVSFFENGKWSFPANMGIKVNTSAWDAQPSLSADGKKLYFASNRLNGQGGNDIWELTKNELTGWGKPKNLGTKINTSGNEESPFIHPDGHTIYFRSNGHIGLGSYDIFMSKMDVKTGEWSSPINLGYPINSEGSDGSLTITLDGKKAYIASDRQSKLKGGTIDVAPNLDIFYFDLPEEFKPDPMSYVKGRIVDVVDKKPLTANVQVIDVNQKDTIVSKGDVNGEFVLALPLGNNYAFQILKDGYYVHSENFNTTSINQISSPYVLDIALRRIENESKEEVTVLNNIFFETASYVLLPQSFIEIDYLVSLLKKYPNKKIKIIGHTDNIGADTENFSLSEQRAKAVVDALIEKKVSPSRLYFEGRGESEPLDTNETEQGRSKNRRTEFIFVDEPPKK